MVKLLLGVVLILATTTNACFLCESKLKESGGLNAFVEGVFQGLQLNPNYPSPCLRKMSNIKFDWADMITNLKDIFNVGDISLYFDAVSEFANMFNDLDDSISLCQFDLITNQLSNLFTPSEASVMAVRISANSSLLISYWVTFANDMGTDNLSSGKAFGKFLSLLFDYTI